WLREGVDQDPSRQAKIQAYEEAQVSPSAAARNLALPPRRGGRSLRLVSFNVHFHRDCRMKPSMARILEAIEKLDADVIALQEVGIPDGLGESGRWSAKDGELTPKKVGSPPDAADAASLVEAMSRQLFDSTGVALGSAKTKEDGAVLLKHLSDLGYREGVYSPAFRSGIAGFTCGNAVLSRYPLEQATTVMLD
ncbi:unnamed protein product, partial [Symbiodinium sp. CCMP2456]